MEVTWGEVTSVSPTVDVRIAGDSVDVTVGIANTAYTPTVNDKVALLKLGSSGGWVIAFDYGAVP